MLGKTLSRLPVSVLLMLLSCMRAFGATYYVATNGSSSGSGTSGAPWSSLSHAFDEMTGGDTLIIRDGTYTEPIEGRYGDGVPSGSAFNYTVVKAENNFRVLIDGSDLSEFQCALSLSHNYIQVEGIKFRSNPTGNSHTVGDIYGNHIKIIRCAFYDVSPNGNIEVIACGEGSSYILFEECWTWTTGRYKFLAYQADHVIFRRCVSRHDYHNPDQYGYQSATFTMYDTRHFLIQNCIAINSGHNPDSYGEVWGGVWSENNDNVENAGKIAGCIFLDLEAICTINDPKLRGAREIENVVIWDAKGGNSHETAGGAPSLSASHLTVGEIWGSYGDESHAWGTGVAASSGIPGSVTNSLFYNCNSYGVSGSAASDYNDFYSNSSDFGNGATPGTNDQYLDPGLRYICRIEEDSPLKGAASDGGDIGANVLYRYGVSGTLWGEPGFDSLTNEPLWPFPNEDEIKADMSTWVGPPDGKRGFCADGNGLYGGPITLSSYIWEYLGNPMPDLDSLYGNSSVRFRTLAAGSVPAAFTGDTRYYDLHGRCVDKRQSGMRHLHPGVYLAPGRGRVLLKFNEGGQISSLNHP